MKWEKILSIFVQYDMKKEQDFLLWSNIQKGDTISFRKLYDSYFDVLFSGILKHVPIRQDAEDILQDVFVTLWQDREQINIQSSVFSYIYSIMRFKVLRHLQGKKISSMHNNLWTALTTEAYTPLFLEQDPVNEQWDFLEKNVSQLPVQLKKVYTMHIEQRESVSNVAEEMDLSRHTVKNYIKDIKKRSRIAANTELPGK